MKILTFFCFDFNNLELSVFHWNGSTLLAISNSGLLIYLVDHFHRNLDMFETEFEYICVLSAFL